MREGEGTGYEGAAGGESWNARQGLRPPGRKGKQPRTRPSGARNSGKATGPPRLENPGGRNPALEHPGQKRVTPDWNVRGGAKRRTGRRQEQAGDQSRQPRTRRRNLTTKVGEEKKATVSEVRREGGNGAAQKETTSKARRRRIVGPVPRTGTSVPGQEQATKHQSPLDWSIQGAAEKGRQAQGARARTSEGRMSRQAVRPIGLEHPGGSGQQPGLDHPGPKQVASDWSVRGCARRRRRQEQAAKSKKIKSKERDQDGGRGEQRRGRMNGSEGGTRQCKGKKGQPGREHPGKNEQAGNRATGT